VILRGTGTADLGGGARVFSVTNPCVILKNRIKFQVLMPMNKKVCTQS
jgi:hypothetical protein